MNKYAKQLDKELDYEYIERDGFIEFVWKDGKLIFGKITFNLKNRYYLTNFPVLKYQHEFITQQMKELGWIDE